MMMKNTDIDDLLVFRIYETIFVKMDFVSIKSYDS